ncbi:hydrolase [Agreia sp. Leaf244]|uniref:endonuclease/exonuclease/phosphatase family protein n=1 Tax=Agreia sp. Leaf244 TaxID=1736305 RepID=UPI0006F3CEE6|nr:endonuclease/exonuclease/phosphatase family protein [Agreia sp. Leaf244]KQO11432.1 hydrolase [Agreia sp. Leaf244]
MTDAPIFGEAHAPDLHVMTYNIRRRMRQNAPGSPDLWSRRQPLMRQLLSRERPTLLGTQEALPDQALFISAVLGPHYRRIGYGRNADGTGEGCPLFYDSRRLHLESWRQIALSETPDVAGSRSWGNMIPRIAVVARFVDVKTGEPLRVINTHFDHIARRARLHSAEQLAALATSSDEPVIVMGDTNTDVGTAPFEAIAGDAGPLVDAWTAAGVRLTPPWGTFSNYRTPKTGTKRIDWILVSPGIEVREAAINASRFDGAAASDHEPVQVLVRPRKALPAERTAG